MSDMKSKQITAETQKDTYLQRIMALLHGKWPRGECQPYYNIRAELSVVNGLLVMVTKFGNFGNSKLTEGGYAEKIA